MMTPSTSLCTAENLYYLAIKARGQRKMAAFLTEQWADMMGQKYVN